MEEIWKPVKDYEGLYEVSNMGRVKSLNREFLCSNGQIKKNKEKIKNNHADISGKNHPCYGKYNNNGKKIVQLSEKGELIKIWNSGMEIKRELGYDPSYISKCCNKKKDMCHGYKWIFYEEYVEKIN